MRFRGGVKVVAAFEASKGLLILLAGFGLLSLIHQNVQLVAQEVVSHFHLNPSSHYPQVFIQLAADLTDGKLWMMAGFALIYSGMRLIEAYGLWNGRRWAEWLAVMSGGLYVPIEIHEIANGITWLKCVMLMINLSIVVYMAIVLRHSPANQTFEAQTR